MTGWFVKRGKFRNVKQTYDGRSFASGLERAVYAQLRALEKENMIVFVRQQATVQLTEAAIIYKPDFEIKKIHGDGSLETCFVEAKGFCTPEWKLKLRLYRVYGSAPLWIYKGTKTRLILDEVVTPEKYTRQT